MVVKQRGESEAGVTGAVNARALRLLASRASADPDAVEGACVCSARLARHQFHSAATLRGQSTVSGQCAPAETRGEDGQGARQGCTVDPFDSGTSSPRAKTKRHRWGDAQRFINEARPDISKTERPCIHPGCNIIRVTRHESGEHWVEFWKDGERIDCERTPVCEGGEK